MWKKFSTQTGIRGFVHAENAQNLCEKLMWYCIIVIAAGLTGWDVHDSLKYFLSNPTSTRLSIMNNASIAFEPTLCVPFSTHFENVNEMSNESVSKLLTDTWPQLSARINSTEIIISTDSLMKVLSLSLAVVNSNSRAQYLGSFRSAKYNYNYSWAFVRLQPRATNNWILEGYNQVKSAADWFRRNNVKMEDLMRISGALLCRFSLIFFEFSSDSVGQNHTCLINEISWVGLQPLYPFADFFCLPFPSRYFIYNASSDVTTLTVQLPPSFQPQAPPVITMDLSGDPVISLRTKNILRISMNSHLTVQIQISAKYKQINHLDNSCTRNNAQPVCLISCIQEYIEKWCHCSPVPKLKKVQSGQPECHVESFARSKSENSTNCRQLQTNFQITELCFPKSVKQCEYYVVFFTYLPMLPTNLPNTSSVHFFVDTFDYAVSEEFYLVSFKQFLSSLGGNLSLYLGASFLAIFHAFYFWSTSLIVKPILKIV